MGKKNRRPSLQKRNTHDRGSETFRFIGFIEAMKSLDLSRGGGGEVIAERNHGDDAIGAGSTRL